MWQRFITCILSGAAAAAIVLLQVRHLDGQSAAAGQTVPKKHVLAWADVRNGYQHDSISHSLATIEQLGRESRDYDTFIRTDSQPITKRPIVFPAGTGIASGEQ